MEKENQELKIKKFAENYSNVLKALKKETSECAESFKLFRKAWFRSKKWT